jgi:hypothetical protein
MAGRHVVLVAWEEVSFAVGLGAGGMDMSIYVA